MIDSISFIGGHMYVNSKLRYWIQHLS